MNAPDLTGLEIAGVFMGTPISVTVSVAVKGVSINAPDLTESRLKVIESLVTLSVALWVSIPSLRI